MSLTKYSWILKKGNNKEKKMGKTDEKLKTGGETHSEPSHM